MTGETRAESPVPPDFANLEPSSHTQWLLTQAENAARAIEDPAAQTDAIIAVAEQLPADAEIWSDVREAANDDRQPMIQRVRALTVLSRHAEDDEQAKRHWSRALHLVTESGAMTRLDSSSVADTLRAFDDLAQRQDDYHLLQTLRDHANRVEAVDVRSTIQLLIASRAVSLGHTDALDIVPDTEQDRHDLVAMRAEAYARGDYTVAAFNLGKSLRTAGKVRVQMAVAMAKGPKAGTWDTVVENIREPFEFSPHDRLALVKGLLASGRSEAAIALTETIPLEESVDRDYRTEAAIAVAEHQVGEQGDWSATLERAQAAVMSVRTLAVWRKGTLGESARQNNEAIIQNCNHSLNQLATARIALTAKHDPDAAWEALENANFAEENLEPGQPTPHERAQAAVIRTLAQESGLLSGAISEIDHIANPGLRSQLYLELAVTIRRKNAALHITAPEVERPGGQQP